MEDIAVVGLGLRFPGEATSPEELWGVLERGESQWSEFPADRLNIDGYFHPGGDRQGSISFRGAHFLKGDIAAFDSPFFSVAAEDAKAIDPQQRMLLEVSYEAFESAGVRREDLDGSDTAVYVGSFVKDYEQICLRDPDWQPRYAATGNGIAIMANRISHFFNLHGPSMTLDTGCSGSLVSVHLSAQSLRNGECSLALAAGSGLILTPNTIMPMTALNFLSPDGKCFTFDARANGYGRGEGIGVVVLKRISDAIRDNDTIRAVIRGTAVNQDGRTPGITLPSKEAQVSNIRAVYAGAGLDFDQTAYVECHGTGTQAGDWRELRAISETLGAGRPADQPVVVGSIKPNIGHLEGAAGVAGMIKGIMVLEHAKIPPNINFESGNPAIDFVDWRVKVPESVMEWPIEGLRRVSINCFGFGGTNAHVVLDEAPAYLSTRGLTGHHSSVDDASSSVTEVTPSPLLYCYSSHEKSGVVRIIDSHMAFFRARQQASSTSYLRDYAYTLNCRRSTLEWRAFVVSSSLSDISSKVQNMENSAVVRASRDKKPRICFVFCGQGAQWAQMGKQLLTFNVFRLSLEDAGRYMRGTLGAPFDVLSEMLRGEDATCISQTHISQPATTALQVALVDLFQSFGINAQHVVGHSSGEIAAAYAAGALTRQEAWQVAYYRGLAASSIPIQAPKLKGGMMVVGMSHQETEAYLGSAGLSAQVACINSPRSITISGQAEAIESIHRDLRSRKIYCRILNVNIAYHSSHMKLVSHDYKESLAQISPRVFPRPIAMVSSVTGEAVKGAELDAAYWARNMTSPVQYVAAVQTLMRRPIEQRPNTIIELSPQAALRSPTSDILSGEVGDSLPVYRSVLGPKVDGATALLELVGELWSRGYPVVMKAVLDRGSSWCEPKCLTDLPPYPWNHSKSYWHESHLSLANRFREYGRQDLIGAPTADSVPFEPRWRGFLRVSENPWIQDHQVQKTIVYPAAGMVTMVLEGARQMKHAGVEGYEISNMQIERAMIIPNTAHGLEVALNIKASQASVAAGSGPVEFCIYSKPLERDWERNARGSLHFRTAASCLDIVFRSCDARHEALKASCTEGLKPRQLYEFLDTVGMNYGTLFQNITEIRKAESSCVAKVRVPDTKSKMPAKFEFPHLIHPATLDSMFQTLFAIDSSPMVPTFIKSLFVSANARATDPSPFSGYAEAQRTGICGANASIFMKGSGSAPAHVVIDGLHLTGLSTPSPADGGFLPNHRNLCTEIVWEQDAAFACPTLWPDLVALLAHKYPGLTVLQVGGSHEAVVRHLAMLAPEDCETPRLSRYTVIEKPGSGEAESALSRVKGTSSEHFLESKKDASELVADYHLIIALSDHKVDLAILKKHLRVGGVLVTDYNRETNGAMSVQGLEASCRVSDKPDGGRCLSMYRKNPDFVAGAAAQGVIILLPCIPSAEAQAFAAGLKQELAKREPSLAVSLVALQQIPDDTAQLTGRVVISLLDFDHYRTGFVFSWDESGFKAFHAMQRSARGILWITRGAHMKPLNPTASPIIALARTLMSEDPLKTIVTLDLGMRSRLEDSSVLNNAVAVFRRSFQTNPGQDPRETEYAEEDGKIYVPRLNTVRSLNRLIEGSSFKDSRVQRQFSLDPASDPRQPGLGLTIAKPGIDNDSMYFSELDDDANLGPDEVEIELGEAILTHLDLDTVMGRTVESTIGMDVSGVVRRVGCRVVGLDPADSVVALVSGGAMRNPVRAKARLVKKCESRLVPSLYASAYHAIVGVGRARKGRKVLVQAGASAYGLAAVEMARSVDAEVFATVLGSEAVLQRERLVSHGVASDHIFNADSDSFVKAVLGATKGKGVDIVYNPTQEHVESGFKCLGQCGTVVQFASKSCSPQALPMLEGSVTVVNLDLRKLLRDEEEYVAEMLDGAVGLMTEQRPALGVESGSAYGVDRLTEALDKIQKMPYLDYASVNAEGCTVAVVNKTPTKPLSQALDGNGTYLLAGGLGGLGQSISELLVRNGARHLAFVSRSAAASPEAGLFIDGLRARGVDARAYNADMCDAAALAELVAGRVTAEMPPIRGVFQCAAVIKDAVFDNMTFADWEAATRPKMAGSLNLVRAMADAGQEPWFVFLASSAGVIGNRGQANYAAGNGFEDALARCCRLRGQRAVAIDLGPVLGAGMLAEDDDLLTTLRASGFYGIRHGDFLKVVEHAITMETTPGTAMPAQVVLGVGTGGIIRQNQPADPYWSRTALFAHLNLVDMPPPDLAAGGPGRDAAAAAAEDAKTRLARCADTAAAADIVRAGLVAMLAKAMTMLPEELDANKPPNAYGVDSLVAVGVRNFVISSFGVAVSVFDVLSDTTIAELSTAIAVKGGFGTEQGVADGAGHGLGST